MKKIFGKKARYTGKEYKWMDKVVIIGAMVPRERVKEGRIDYDPDCEHIYIDTERELEIVGGIKPDDLVDVLPIRPDGTTGWVSCDLFFRDLEIIG